jgi:hypothetical protein
MPQTRKQEHMDARAKNQNDYAARMQKGFNSNPLANAFEQVKKLVKSEVKRAEAEDDEEDED